MYSVNLIKKDIEKVNAMMNVISDFADGTPFKVCDIPIEKRKGYYTKVNSWDYKEKFDFTGSTARALCDRGLLEVVGTEDFIYVEYNGRKCIGTHAVYRCTGKTVEDYKNALAFLIPKAILA